LRIMEQGKREWNYRRIDTHEDEHGQLKGQKKELIYYAGHLGLDVIGVLDYTGSGLDFERPGLAEVSMAASEGRIDVHLITGISRLSRDVIKTAAYIDQLYGQGLRVYSPLDGEIIYRFQSFKPFGIQQG
jgi:Site-specific recombinases, DNA invertase Pin homologs